MQSPAVSQPPLLWELDTFSHLPPHGVGDLATYVDQFAHPASYTSLTATSAALVEAIPYPSAGCAEKL